MPKAVGNRIENSAHLVLPVSFFMVRTVVEQGQCIRQNIITQIAVTAVQPFETNICRICSIDVTASILPLERYAITASGKTISFAGNPNIKASSNTPSRPKIYAKGFKNSDK